MMLRSSEKSSRPYCDKCQKKIDMEKVVSCGDCRRNYHNTCVTFPEGASGPWKCNLCSPRQRGETSEQSGNPSLPTTTATEENQMENLFKMIKQLTNLQASASADMAAMREEIKAERAAREVRELEIQDMRAELFEISSGARQTLPQPTEVFRMPERQERELSSNHNNERTSLPMNYHPSERTLVPAPKPADFTTLFKRQALTALPKFYGSPKEWPKFKRIFTESTRECAFTNSENLTRLEAALEGRAAKSVQQLFINSENVPSIIERLEENFGNPKFIYEELLNDIQKLRRESRTIIIEMSDALENMVANMTIINQEGYLLDVRLIDDLVKKLPYNLQIEWARQRMLNHEVPSLPQMSEWLKPHARIMRNITSTTTTRNPVHVHHENERLVRCSICSNNHTIHDCRKFKNMSIPERCEQTVQKKLCFCCLGKGHLMVNCRRSKRCGLNGCNRHHHRMLHSNVATAPPRHENSSPRNSPTPEPVVAETNHHEEQVNKKYYQVIPVTLQNGRHSIDTYAFLDTGSSLTLLDEDMASRLDLHGRTEPLTLKWTKNVSRKEPHSKVVQVRIQGSSRKSYRLDGVRTIRNLQLPTQTLDYNAMAREYPYLNNLPIRSYELVKPTILIGLNQSHLLAAMETRNGGVNDPIAVRCKLGWFIFGNIKSSVEYNNPTTLSDQDEDLREMMATHFSTEYFGVRNYSRQICSDHTRGNIDSEESIVASETEEVLMLTNEINVESQHGTTPFNGNAISKEENLKSKRSKLRHRRRKNKATAICNENDKPTFSKRSGHWCNLAHIIKVIFMIVASLSIINAITIKPIEDDGIIFDHVGTCLLRSGTWRTNIQTNVIPEDDIKMINGIRNNLTMATHDMKIIIKDSVLEQIAMSVERLCDDAIQEIQHPARIKRSKGILGFLADLIFGGNDVDEELQTIRIHEDEKIHQLSESMVKMNSKASKMGEQLTGRYNDLYQDITHLKQLYSKEKAQILQTRMLETTMLAREVIDGLLNKYRKIRSYPLSAEELVETRRNISKILPVGYAILEHPSAVQFNAQLVNGSIVIVMTSVIISKDEFEVFKIVAVPHPHNGSIIMTEEKRIAVNHRKEFFYPSNEMSALNDTHLIIAQPEITRKADCIAAILMHIESTRKCTTRQLATPYAVLEKLTDPNTVLYYASNPKDIIIHCVETVISPPYEAALVTLQPGCRIQSTSNTIYASIKGENKKGATYFKPRYQMSYHITDGFSNTTENSTAEPIAENPYKNDIIAVYNTIDPFNPVPSHIWQYVALALGTIVTIGSIIYLRCRRPNRRTRTEARPEDIAMATL